MTKRRSLFVLLIWNPLMILVGGGLVERYGQEIANLGFVGFVGAFYVYMLMFFAPGLWDAFGPKA